MVERSYFHVIILGGQKVVVGIGGVEEERPRLQDLGGNIVPEPQ
jgi:hypothetical protein